MIGQTISHYEILEKLGQGGMGVVYKARDTQLERLVALKVLAPDKLVDEERTRRLVREAKAASALNHPNIVTIYEIQRNPGGTDFIAMELVEGDTLRAIGSRPLAVELVVEIGRQVAEALAVAHARGIVHRDIKPENIVLRRDRYVKVLDFGLARLTREVTSGSKNQVTTSTLPHAVVGTIAYMSPEQARGDRVTAASDVFSLGLLLYELATGQHPYRFGTALTVLQAIQTEAPLPPTRLRPEIPGQLEDMILRMLAKNPLQRPTAPEVAAIMTDSAVRILGIPTREAAPLAGRLTVGYDKERALLRSCYESSCSGKGALLCVTGESGIGKTTLVEDFLSETMSPGPAIGRGRCSERLAGTEAYLPILDALEGLLRGLYGSQLAGIMRQLAPTWYLQVAAPSHDSQMERLLTAASGASQERRKREIAAFFQETCRLRPLILVLDDLHWADVSTVDILAYLSHRLSSMRMLIVVTYRPTDLLLAKHPFLQVKLELEARGTGKEIPLQFLQRQDIETYLALTFPGHRFPPEFAKLIHSRTEGSPLFMVDLLRYLRDHQVLVQDRPEGGWILSQPLSEVAIGIPDSVRSMIQRKIDRLSEKERRLLSAASVQGREFDSAIVAEALNVAADEAEEMLESLDRIHDLARLVRELELPDRTWTLRYQFVHVLYQNAFYESLRPTRRASLSASIARALIAHFGEQNSTVAAQLALLFAAGRETSRAVDYFLLAARNASGVSAQREAVALARRGLSLLESLPETPQRARQEMQLRSTLAVSLMTLNGYASSEAAEAWARALMLSQELGDVEDLIRSQMGLGVGYLFRPQIRKGLEIQDQMLRLAEGAPIPGLHAYIHMVAACLLSHSGDFVDALQHLDRHFRFYNPRDHTWYVSFGGINVGVFGQCQWGRVLWFCGDPDQARIKTTAALAEARTLAHPYTLCFCLIFSAWVLEYLRDAKPCEEIAAEAMNVASDEGYGMCHAWAGALRGWAVAEQGRLDEGIVQMKCSLDSLWSAGTGLIRPEFLGLLAAATARQGDLAGALAFIDEALTLVQATDEHYYDAELYRLKGELLRRAPDANAEEAASFIGKSLEIARRQGAKSLELRAATSMGRLHLDLGRPGEARTDLAGIYGWFADRLETPDLADAREVLDRCQ